MSEKDILCYDCSEHRVFSFEPLKLDTVPFKLPSPFRKANEKPCCVVIRPSKGDFLSDYEVGDDLHVAVTDSQGKVVEFDKKG